MWQKQLVIYMTWLSFNYNNKTHFRVHLDARYRKPGLQNSEKESRLRLWNMTVKGTYYKKLFLSKVMDKTWVMYEPMNKG